MLTYAQAWTLAFIILFVLWVMFGGDDDDDKKDKKRDKKK